MWEIFDHKENKVLAKSEDLDELEKKFEEMSKEDPSLLEDERIEFQLS